MYEMLYNDDNGMVTDYNGGEITIEDAQKHFIDLLNLHPLFKGYIEAFQKVLRDAGWNQAMVAKCLNSAVMKSDWRKPSTVKNRMERFERFRNKKNAYFI